LFALLGLGSGAIYALLAQGIVLTYRGTGVVNFSQGALAMAGTYLFAQIAKSSLPAVVDLIVTVLIALLFGAWIYAKVMRPLRTAPMLAKVVATLGIVLAMQAIVTLMFSTSLQSPPKILPQGSVDILGAHVTQDRIWLTGIAIACGVALWAIYKYTRFGLVARAVAENEEAATVLGYSVDLVAAVNWALGAGLAAAAGILMAPIVAIDPTSYTLLVIPALSAALLGRFSSFGVVTGSALAIGVAQSLISRYLTAIPNASDALPFVVIIVAMTVTGRLVPLRGHVDFRRPPFATAARPSVTGIGLFAIFTVLIVTLGTSTYQTALTTTCVSAIILLSLVVITGYAGQLSLAQISFAGIGAFMISRLGHNLHWPFLLALLGAAVVAVPVGVIVGLPALRSRGVNLAIITLGVAVALNDLVFTNPSISGGFLGLPVDTPRLFGYDLDPIAYPARFTVFSVIVLGIVVAGISWLRMSGLGRRMLAIRDNERAAAAAGVNVTGTKLAAFAISAFIAGLGGALQGAEYGVVSQTGYDALTSVFLVSTLYIMGVGSVGGAVVAGILATSGLVSVFFVSHVPSIDLYITLLGGLGVVATAIHAPDGVMAAHRERVEDANPDEAPSLVPGYLVRPWNAVRRSEVAK
jgi:ABC-type branched-subunit amino acid transport system permease subunit